MIEHKETFKNFPEIKSFLDDLFTNFIINPEIISFSDDKSTVTITFLNKNQYSFQKIEDENGYLFTTTSSLNSSLN